MSPVIDRIRGAALEGFPSHWRDRFALLVAIVAFVAGTYVFMNVEPSNGVMLGVDGERIVVTDIQPWSNAWEQGFRPGMVAVEVDGQPVLGLGTQDWPKMSPADLEWIAASPWPSSISVIAAEDAAGYDLDRYEGATYATWSESSWAIDNSGWAVGLGLLILLVSAWYVGSGRAGSGLQPFAIPIAVASAVPLALVGIDLVEPTGPLLATGLLVLALLPLADGLSTRILDASTRRDVRLAVVAVAIVLIVGYSWRTGTPTPIPGGWRLLGAAVIPLLPAVVASRPRSGALADGGVGGSRWVADSSELVLVSITPAVSTLALTFAGAQTLLWPILLWLAALLAATRFTVRPLLRVATRAQLQRDLVVAASEAERARLAADLHDDALQDLTLLVRRLDAAGDVEGAAQARAIADRLRDICGDLRLPILDDLGVGPALDWLVLRIERLAGGEVRLERTEGTRPPADIELAVFRVAQEALANAVKHGRPPIVVRYQATASGVSLSIDDAGPGIEAEAREAATAGGHFGLLNMQQRAEAIGALLDVRRWPSGGTHVALEWRAG